MALKDDWIDLENKVQGDPDSGSEITVEPINKIAHAVIKNEEDIFENKKNLSKNEDDILSLRYYGDETIRPTDNSYFSFELIDGEATVSLAEGASTSLKILIIPYKCEIDGVEYEVKRTGNYSFAYMSLLEKVVLPECLTIIEEGSFNQCKKLQNVEFPKNLKEIRQWAFGYCAFSSIVIPDGVNTLGNRAFSKCPNLNNITIPISVTHIGAGIFEDCTSLATVFLHNSIINAGSTDAQSFFSGCTSLKNVYLGPFEILGAYMFEGCNSLKYIEIEEGTEKIGHNVFKDCTALERISIPDSVTFIDAAAFTNCPLINIVCPKGSYAESFAIENDIPYKYHTIEVDAEINDSSENPVQNKVIAQKIGDINAALDELHNYAQALISGGET